MIFNIGDKVTINDGSISGTDVKYETGINGVVHNIKYDAVANTYVILFENGKKDIFYRFQLKKL